MVQYNQGVCKFNSRSLKESSTCWGGESLAGLQPTRSGTWRLKHEKCIWKMANVKLTNYIDSISIQRIFLWRLEEPPARCRSPSFDFHNNNLKMLRSSQTFWERLSAHSLTQHEPRTLTCDIPPVKALSPAPVCIIPWSHSGAEWAARSLNLTCEHPFYSSFACHNWIQSSTQFTPGSAKPADRSTDSSAHCPDVGKGTAWDGAWMAWGGLLQHGSCPCQPPLSVALSPPVFCLSRCLPIGRDTGRPLFICPPRALQPFREQTEKTVRVCLRWSHRVREGKGRCRGEGGWVQRGREAKWLRSCCRHAAPCDWIPLQSDGSKKKVTRSQLRVTGSKIALQSPCKTIWYYNDVTHLFHSHQCSNFKNSIKLWHPINR